MTIIYYFALWIEIIIVIWVGAAILRVIFVVLGILLVETWHFGALFVVVLKKKKK